MAMGLRNIEEKCGNSRPFEAKVIKTDRGKCVLDFR